MSTSIRYERNPMMSAAHLTSDDGGHGYVFCSIPGGTPWYSPRRDGPAITCANAPQCQTHREFVAFVAERFGS